MNRQKFNRESGFVLLVTAGVLSSHFLNANHTFSEQVFLLVSAALAVIIGIYLINHSIAYEVMLAVTNHESHEPDDPEPGDKKEVRDEEPVPDEPLERRCTELPRQLPQLATIGNLRIVRRLQHLTLFVCNEPSADDHKTPRKDRNLS